MNELDLEVLKNISDINISDNINPIYETLLQELRSYLKLDIINPNVKLIYTKREVSEIVEKKGILDLGVKRYEQNNYLIIEVFDDYTNFLPFILLREAYYCFVPDILKENDTVKIFINQIVENNLKDLEVLKEWNLLIRNDIVNYDFLSSTFDRLEKFLKLQGTEKSESSAIFFFDYIRRNILVINDKKEDFLDTIFKEFVFKFSKSMNNDEIIETIRVLIKIFYEVKSYRALLDYKEFFKEFKENGKIKTNLSLRKFTENMQWINKCSYIAPSYQINYNALNLSIILCIFEFNPVLTNEQVEKFIETLPFFVNSKSSSINFGISISGWFNIPNVYIKDLIRFLDKLEENGFLIKKTCFSYKKHENNLNLNYFREYFSRIKIVNPNHRNYNKNYEIKFEFNFGQKYYRKELSILEYLILDRIRYWSITGFSFERRTESLRKLKSDYFNEILSQRTMIEELKNSLEIIYKIPNLQEELSRFINSNLHYGFFYIKYFLENSINVLDLLEDCLSTRPDINNPTRLNEFLEKSWIFKTLENNLALRKNDFNKITFHDIIPLYFSNKKKFIIQKKKYLIFLKLFKTISNLKVFNLKAVIQLINDKNLVNKIYSEKERRLKKLYEKKLLQEITSNDIDNILDNFINTKPPLIIPLLLTTINTTSFSKYYIQFILRKSNESVKTLDELKKFFPRVIINEGSEIFTELKIIQVEIYLPNINIKEKRKLISILRNLFGENLILLRRYFWDGFRKAFTRKDFYDFENKRFFYTSDLFEQYLIFVKKIFKNKLKRNIENSKYPQMNFYSPNDNMFNLISDIQDRVSRQQINFNSSDLNDLRDFNNNLEKNLLNQKEFKIIKNQEFFKKFIDAIKFIPSYQHFGLGEYFLYLRPADSRDLDIKLLIANTFKKIEYPAFVDNNTTLLIRYIYPYRNPNLSYINWLSKSKRVIGEYCIFFVKKIYQILHFDYNLTSEGWNLDSNRFKAYLQKILFDLNLKFAFSKPRVVNIGDLKNYNIYGPDSIQFKNLAKISGWKSLDVKSIIGTKNYSLSEKIISLIQKKLIFPYLKLKNLGLIEKILIILPKVEQELNNSIVKIFSFFNYGFIYEIEGKYFIKGLADEVNFENGLVIELYLPDIDFSEFQQIFSKLFQLLRIKKYLILSDMVGGKSLIKNFFGSLDFLESYNPLKNLKWSKKDQRWINHKLFGENFEPIYPDLF